MGTMAAGDEGVRASMVNEVDVLVRLFEAKLGTDLETFTTHNPFWHTGQATNMRAADCKHARPWEWIWRVAAGRTLPFQKRAAGRDVEGRKERWTVWVTRHIRDHMFSQ